MLYNANDVHVDNREPAKCFVIYKPPLAPHHGPALLDLLFSCFYPMLCSNAVSECLDGMKSVYISAVITQAYAPDCFIQAFCKLEILFK